MPHLSTSAPASDCLTLEFLDQQARSVLSFYFPACLDFQAGGYHQYFLADGSPDTSNHSRHLVSSCRLAINFAVAARHFDDEEFRTAAQHGIDFIRQAHRNPTTGGYAWIIDKGVVQEGDNQAYGIAFVMMAYARAFQAGVSEAHAHIAEAFEFLEQHFWEERHSLYAETRSADLTQLAPYRGQNSNMHCCEALTAAYEATGDSKYIDRAIRVARQLTVVLTSRTGGRIWEHYDAVWAPDFAYNRGDTRNKLRPWGYQPGHFTEWAKLLLLINQHEPQPWLVERARELFEEAMSVGYDAQHGGLYYAVAPDGTVCADGKYSWVQAETIAAAAFLGSVTQDGMYWCVYRQLWSYATENMIDQQLGFWHRNLTRDNLVLTDIASMGRTDYHAFCACIEISNQLKRSAPLAATTSHSWSDLRHSPWPT